MVVTFAIGLEAKIQGCSRQPDLSLSPSPEGWDTTETPHRSPTTPRLGFSFNSAMHTGEICLSSAFDVAEEGNEIHKLQPSFSSKVLSSS